MSVAPARRPEDVLAPAPPRVDAVVLELISMLAHVARGSLSTRVSRYELAAWLHDLGDRVVGGGAPKAGVMRLADEKGGE